MRSMTFFAQLLLEVSLLGWAKLVVEDYDVGLKLLLEFANFLQLALADVEATAFIQPLGHGCDHLRAGGICQLGQFFQGGLEAPGAAGAFELHTDEQGTLRPAQGP